MQQAADVGIECGRKVAFVGRSMRKNANIARNLGYMDVPDEVILRPHELAELPPHQQLILCTGSQGEPMSAMTRIAYNDHPAVTVEAGDTVIISAKPIPGNELRVHDAINRLARSGAEVLHEDNAPVHVSGHGRAEELRTIIGLAAAARGHARARRVPHARRARAARARGRRARRRTSSWPRTAPSSSSPDGVARIVDHVQAGMTFVDGLGVGDVHDVALRDRRRLSEDGVLIVVATLAASNGSGALDRAARADRARVRRRRGAAPRRAAQRGGARARGAPRATTSPRSSSCRSICTTRSAASSTTARAGGR